MKGSKAQWLGILESDKISIVIMAPSFNIAVTLETSFNRYESMLPIPHNIILRLNEIIYLKYLVLCLVYTVIITNSNY